MHMSSCKCWARLMQETASCTDGSPACVHACAQVRYAGEVALGPGSAELVRTEERVLDAREADAVWGAAVTGAGGGCCKMPVCMVSSGTAVPLLAVEYMSVLFQVCPPCAKQLHAPKFQTVRMQLNEHVEITGDSLLT